MHLPCFDFRGWHIKNLSIIFIVVQKGKIIVICAKIVSFLF